MNSEFRDEICHDIYSLLSILNATAQITYISTKDNFRADSASREFNDRIEWSLDDHTFQQLRYLAPLMNFDLFVSHLNNKLPLFCSWNRTPGCSHVDAFTFNWNSHVCYAFPPYSILGKCMEEILKQEVELIYFLIPWWKTAVWFPQMVQLLVQPPKIAL